MSPNKKWYNLFVSVGPPQADAPAGHAAEAASSAAQTIADIAASIAPPPEPVLKPPAGRPGAPPAPPSSFAELYDNAEIRPPAHGFTILKVADLLHSEHIRDLPREVKRSSVLLALEAGGGAIQDVIQDAVRRDRALDTYEQVQQRGLGELQASKARENEQIQAELDRLAAEHRARMEANNDAVARERERFYGWRLKKQEEEQKIADAVSYFVTENPITTGAAAEPPTPAGGPPGRK